MASFMEIVQIHHAKHVTFCLDVQLPTYMFQTSVRRTNLFDLKNIQRYLTLGKLGWSVFVQRSDKVHRVGFPQLNRGNVCCWFDTIVLIQLDSEN